MIENQPTKGAHMKLNIERILKPLTEKTGNRPDGTPWKFSFTDVDGKLDGKPVAGVTLKAWNGDAKRIAAGAELEVKLDEKARDGETAYVVMPERKTGGGKGGFGAGAARGGLTPMQFLLDQRGKLASVALTEAVAMVKGTEQKALPVAGEMFKWLCEMSAIGIEEKRAMEA